MQISVWTAPLHRRRTMTTMIYDGSSPQSRKPPDVGLGGIVTLVGKTNSQNDVDDDVDVVTDDTMAFGRPQFTERDVVEVKWNGCKCMSF